MITVRSLVSCSCQRRNLFITEKDRKQNILAMSKRDYKRKRKEEQEAAAHVFQDFIDTFQNTTAAIANKTFVRSAVLYGESEENENVGQIYNPKPVIKQFSDANSAIECAKILKDTVVDKSKRRQERPKSNLDLLKEELKQKHAERGEKDKFKEELDLPAHALTLFEGGDTTSTNLFVANLSPKITENQLMLQFGAYGPLASVKIMWPRADDKFRNSNCGFVAFMSRKDAERALKENRNREDMRVGWGKSVEIPPYPIFIPDELLKLYLPPPSSGLPFNAQPPRENFSIPTDKKDFDKLLYDSPVKVTIPLSKTTLAIVHRMVEFVIREGPMFEAVIMNREIRNPDFQFLFEYHSPIHVYYRWKLFSILNGDSQKSWSMKPFRMFRGGSVWLPPVAPNYTAGMPVELIKGSKMADDSTLSESQCTRLVALLRNLSMQRSKIADAMVFCMNHKGALNESIDIIIDSLGSLQTSPPKKVARMYLLSDIITNCMFKRIKVNLEENDTLLEVFKSLHQFLNNIPTNFDKDNFKSRIMRVIRHWELCKIFPATLVRKLESIFLNNLVPGETPEDDTSSADEPLDGANLLKRSLKNDVGPDVVTSSDLNKKKSTDTFVMEYFVPSKWDAVDPEEVEAQAMSTEKLYYMQLEKEINTKVRERGKKRKRISS